MRTFTIHGTPKDLDEVLRIASSLGIDPPGMAIVGEGSFLEFKLDDINRLRKALSLMEDIEIRL